MNYPLREIPNLRLGCRCYDKTILLQLAWLFYDSKIFDEVGRQKECGVKRWVKKLPWKFFDSWNMGLRFPIWDWVAGAMTKCIVPAWLYCAPHVSGSYGSYIVYAFSAVTLFDNKFTLPASCKLKVGTMAQCGLKIKVRKSRKQFMVSSIFPNKNEQFFYPILSRFYRNCLEISG